MRAAQVVVRKAPRNAGGKDDSWLYYLQRGSWFTHHQKSVIMDAPQVQSAPSASGSTRIIGFMGGLDLCDGRCASALPLQAMPWGSCSVRTGLMQLCIQAGVGWGSQPASHGR